MSPGACIVLLLVPLLTALDPAAARAAESGDPTRLVDINGARKMYLECRGSGSPTVVLIAGLAGSNGSVLTRASRRDQHPELTPILTSRHRGPAGRRQGASPGPIRTPLPTGHRNLLSQGVATTT